MDPENRVVKLCAAGMMAEGRGEPDTARAAFEEAWQCSQDDYERAIAAHYVARHALTPAEVLHWNRTALECALRVDAGRVADFLPSLHLNLAKSLEDTGAPAEASVHYRHAHASLRDATPGPFLDFLSRGIDAGLARVAQGPRNTSSA